MYNKESWPEAVKHASPLLWIGISKKIELQDIIKFNFDSVSFGLYMPLIL